MRDTKPPEGHPDELTWLRGYEAGVIQMREDVGLPDAIPDGVHLLLDLYRRHMRAMQDGDEQLRGRLFALIEEFEWAFPKPSEWVKKTYPGK